MKRWTVALLYNLKQNAPHEEGEPWDKWNELDSEKTVGGIERALRAGGHEVVAMEGDKDLPKKLEHYKIDIAFNTCEGHRGASREAQVPALLDLLGIPFTGSGVLTLALALDKAMTKRLLRFHGLPTPEFQTLASDEPINPSLKFPLFVKPVMEGSGMGITAKSVCHNARELRAQVKYVVDTYRQAALVEEYIEGRELTIGLLGNLPHHIRMGERVESEREAELVNPGATRVAASARPRGNGRNGHNRAATVQTTLRVFPALEVDLTPVPMEEAMLYTSVVKSKLYEVPKYICPAPLTKMLRSKIEKISAGAFAALDCYDFARIDVRIRNDTGEPTILEVNPLAGLQEGISDIVMEAEAAGVNYTALINGILDAALERYGMI
jgi:D-alanine-D-alanine ligase